MKAYSKFLIVLSLTIFTLLLTGCMEKQENSTPSEEEGESGDVVTITTARTIDDTTQFKEGEDVNNNVVTRWAKDELGINFDTEWTVSGGEQYNQQIRLTMAAGNKLPDVFQVGDEQLMADLIDSGLVMSIDEAIEEYASDRLKAMFNEFPEAFYPATKDGERYGIPRFSGGDGSDSLLWIRQDWLDKFDLEAPETIEDLENIMDKFVNGDPNETGKDDTLGLSLSTVNGLATWLAEGSFIAGAYGDYLPQFWSENEDGELVYGSIQPNVKQALEKLSEWYEKGYLDVQVGIQDETTAVESFVSGKSGIVSAPAWAVGWPIEDVYKNVEDAVVQSYPLPGGPDGQAGRSGEKLITGVFFFSKDFEHIDKFFEYFDAIYGYTLNDSEYFEEGLFEGYDYVVEDGEVIYDQEKIAEITGEDFVDPSKYFIMTDDPTVPFMLTDIMAEFYETGREPETPYEFKNAAKGEEYLRAAWIIKEQSDLRIENEFTGPPTETMRSKGELLDKMENELFAKIIMGDAPVSDFDSFVERWLQSGGSEITEEVNEWYQSVTQ